MILALKTAGELTEIKLVDHSGQILTEEEWHSGRQLAEGLLAKITEILEREKLNLAVLSGIVVFRGPGSFTSLRVGIATVNALAYALEVPNVGAEGEDWLRGGLADLAKQRQPQIVTPLYDRGPNTTQPRK